MKNQIFVSAIQVVAVLAIVGCASKPTVISRPIEPESNFLAIDDGLLYALPKRLLRLTVKGSPKSTKLDEDLAKAKKGQEDARKGLTGAKKKKAKLEAELKALQAQNAVARIIQNKQAEIILASAELKKAKKAVPKAETKYQELLAQALGPTGAKLTMSIKLEVLDAIPDPRHWYVATINKSVVRDDKWDLGTTELGLLSNGQSTSIDKTGDILVDIAGLGGVVEGPSYIAQILSDDPPSFEQTPDPCNLGLSFSWQFEFDPLDRSSGINRALRGCGLPFQVRVNPVSRLFGYIYESEVVTRDYQPEQPGPKSTPVPIQPDETSEDGAVPNGDLIENLDDDVIGNAQNSVQEEFISTASSDLFAYVEVDDQSHRTASVDGLLYRRPVPYEISILAKPTVGVFPWPIKTTVVMLPQGGPVGNIPYYAESLVTSVTNTTFVNGQPTKWHSEKPSEVAAAFRIPVAMAKALVSIPAEIIKLRVDYSSNETELVKAQSAYVCALEALNRVEGKDVSGLCPQAVTTTSDEAATEAQ